MSAFYLITQVSFCLCYLLNTKKDKTIRLCQLVSLNEKPSMKYNLFKKMVFLSVKQTTPGSP